MKTLLVILGAAAAAVLGWECDSFAIEQAS